VALDRRINHPCRLRSGNLPGQLKFGPLLPVGPAVWPDGAGVEDVVIGNDRPVGAVAEDVLSFLGWV
jgi:hypothetical protein